jgi:hypothetical protein
MKKLLQKSDVFMREHYAIADLATIREAFLVSYPTLHERDHGEKAPHLRRQGSSDKRRSSPLAAQVSFKEDASATHNFSAADLLRSNAENIDVDVFLELFRKENGNELFEMKTNDINPILLDSLSKKLCDILSKGGKGLISVYELNSLLSAYPHRPVQCVIAASELIKPRAEKSYKLLGITVFDVMKRAAAMEDLHVIESEFPTVDVLISKASDIKSNCPTAKCATKLKEILEPSGKSPTFNKISFQFANRKRIIAEFVTFYSTNAYAEPVDGNISNLSLPSRAELEDIAYSFSCHCSDSLGRGYVSVLELQRYFSSPQNKNDPKAALSNVKELLEVPRPPEPEPAPRPLKNEWIYGWLDSIDPTGDLSGRYGSSFVQEGLGNESDLNVGPVFDDTTLKDIIGVRELGNRRKIIRMHAALVNASV